MLRQTEGSAESTHLLELPLGDTIAVEDDARGLEARGLVELDEQLADHGGQVLNDLLAVLLDPHGGTVAVGVSVHAAHDLLGHDRACVRSPPKPQRWVCTRHRPGKGRSVSTWTSHHGEVTRTCQLPTCYPYTLLCGGSVYQYLTNKSSLKVPTKAGSLSHNTSGLGSSGPCQLTQLLLCPGCA